MVVVGTGSCRLTLSCWLLVVGVAASPDWYGLHFAQTLETSITYLTEVRAWIDAHPSEVVLFWFSKHGECMCGKKRLPSRHQLLCSRDGVPLLRNEHTPFTRTTLSTFTAFIALLTPGW